MLKIDGFSVVSAAVRKSLAPALVADAIGEIAQQRAMNPGAKPKAQALAALCVTTEKGKTRNPAPGTIGALVLAILVHIESTAQGLGCFPASQGGTIGADMGKDEGHKARMAVAEPYAADVRALFLASVQGAADARATAAKVAKDAKDAAAKDAATLAGLTPSTDATAPDGAAVTAPSVAELLTELQALQGVAETLAAVRAELARVTADRDALSAELCTVTAERDALRHAAAQSAALAGETAAAAATAAATAAAGIVGAADMSPTLPQQRKARKGAAAAAAA